MKLKWNRQLKYSLGGAIVGLFVSFISFGSYIGGGGKNLGLPFYIIDLILFSFKIEFRQEISLMIINIIGTLIWMLIGFWVGSYFAKLKKK